MFDPERFKTNSLYLHTNGVSVMRVLAAAFNAVEAGEAVKKYLYKNPLPVARRVFAFGLGKAACAMTLALANETDLTGSLVITKHASPLDLKPVTIIEGDHPIPGNSSLGAGTAALDFLSQLQQDDLLVCLISGGGSALMTSPRIPLTDLQSHTSALLACGARIDEINILRRHLDGLKGGGVVRHANGARVISLLLSDVVGDALEAIASGPTAPDPTTCADALAIIEKYDLKNKIPASILPALVETLKPDDPIFSRVQNTVIASNEIALHAAQVQAQQEGFQVQVIRADLQGEASVLGRSFALQLKESLTVMPRPFCLLAGGEATVTLRHGLALKSDGKGGRNQEFALAAVDTLAGLKDVMLISIATDGEDGPTDAAGAVVTGESAQRAESLGMSTAGHLAGNDAYSFFEALGDLVHTGPSGTNVNDLVLCFAF
jgi:hydroxypyruvate reductase